MANPVFSNVGPSTTVYNPTQGLLGNTQAIYIVNAALAPVAVAANTTAEQTFTITGLQASDMVYLNKPTAQAGLGIVNARVSAANTLAITYVNATAGSLTPTTETYLLMVARPTAYSVINSLPVAIIGS